jgi:hypothetical protein
MSDEVAVPQAFCRGIWRMRGENNTCLSDRQHIVAKGVFDSLRDFGVLPTQQESSDLSFRYLTGGHGGRDCAFGWVEA